jgi:hypothetical protein
MDAQKLSAAIKLSVEAALTSQETTLPEAIGILQIHVGQLTALTMRPRPDGPKIVPVEVSALINGRG